MPSVAPTVSVVVFYLNVSSFFLENFNFNLIIILHKK